MTVLTEAGSKLVRLGEFRREVEEAIHDAGERLNVPQRQAWALALSWLVQVGEANFGTEKVTGVLRGTADDLEAQCRCPKCIQ